MPIEIIYGGDCRYAKGHHDTEAFKDAVLAAGDIVMDEPRHCWARYGFGASDEPQQLGLWLYETKGRGRFPITITEWMIAVYREGDASTRLGGHNYEAAIAEIKRLVALDPEPDTPAGRRLEALSVSLEAYERIHYPIGQY